MINSFFSNPLLHYDSEDERNASPSLLGRLQQKNRQSFAVCNKRNISCFSQQLLICVIIFFFAMQKIFAQPPTYKGEDESKGFKKENIFLGGSIAAGFGSGTFAIGANPEIGYSIAQWLDAGFVFNINYSSISADYNYGVRQHATNYGGGAFFRIFPVRFLFLQGQLEQNWINYKLRDYNSGLDYKINTDAASFLAGVGYAQRIVGQSSFYTVLMIDLMRDGDSPYRDGSNNAIPVIRAGFNIYLRPSRRK